MPAQIRLVTLLCVVIVCGYATRGQKGRLGLCIRACTTARPPTHTTRAAQPTGPPHSPCGPSRVVWGAVGHCPALPWSAADRSWPESRVGFLHLSFHHSPTTNSSGTANGPTAQPVWPIQSRVGGCGSLPGTSVVGGRPLVARLAGWAGLRCEICN
jgi:hypothetical protein